MKNLNLALLFIVLSLSDAVSTQLPNLNDQEVFYQNIATDSWRQKTIHSENIHDGLITDEYLVNSINLNNNLVDIDKIPRFYQITVQNPYSFVTMGESPYFWNKRFRNGQIFNMASVFAGDHFNHHSVFYRNTPRQQQRILNYREIARFNEAFTNQGQNNIATPMISHSNFENDDVIRAMSLCGTFCTFDGFDYEPSFSGMLVPGQPYDQNTFAVHSCLHGFDSEQLTDMYFVPYGIDLTDIDTGQANINNAFPVQSVWREEGMINLVNQNHIDVMDDHYPYANEDYAMVVINGIANNNLDRPLWTVLDDRQNDNLLGVDNLFPNFLNTFNGTLPSFLGVENDFQNFQLGGVRGEKYYVIGRPGDRRFRLNVSGFSVVTNLTDDIYFAPRQSMRNDPDVFNPPNIGTINNRVALTFPSTPGMSGGAILKSFVRQNDHGVWQRLCLPYGTVWGSERNFNNQNNQLNRLVSFSNVIH
jgi:hypothetical protein